MPPQIAALGALPPAHLLPFLRVLLGFVACLTPSPPSDLAHKSFPFHDYRCTGAQIIHISQVTDIHGKRRSYSMHYVTLRAERWEDWHWSTVSNSIFKARASLPSLRGRSASRHCFLLHPQPWLPVLRCHREAC